MSELRDEIRSVLQHAIRGKNPKVHGVLTAYQILHLLPGTLRESLIAKYSEPGKNAGAHFSAASAVATAIKGMGDEVEVDWLDTRHLGVRDGDTAAGNNMCAIYRLKDYGKSTWEP